MIQDLSSSGVDLSLAGEVAVIGAGPAGIVTALEAARHGIDVLLIESGKVSFDGDNEDLLSPDQWDPSRHAPTSLAMRRQVGGASVIWGGRCVPYDPVDFETRPYISSETWPIRFEEISRYFRNACKWLNCGRAVFSASETEHLRRTLVPGLTDGDVTTSTLERWSSPTNLGKAYLRDLTTSKSVRLVTGVTCTQIVCSRGSRRAERLEAQTSSGRNVTVSAQAFVVACGGLESVRLLMSSRGPEGEQLGNQSDNLGRWYMAHCEGVVATVRFHTDPRQTIYGYERDIDGAYVRRRFAFSKAFQIDKQLPNIVGWLTNPELSDTQHGSGPLSFVYLALQSPLGKKLAPDAQRLSLSGERIPGAPHGGGTRSSNASHVYTIARSPLDTAHFVLNFGAHRFLARGQRAPGFFVYNKENRYPLQFHGEHIPRHDSRVTLSEKRDPLGRPKLNIDLRFSSEDVDGVLRAHRHWDEYLRSARIGELAYQSDSPYEAVQQSLGGGFHQIGLARMSASPRKGVVDKNLGVYGVENLYVASSATFVTSSQANSTLLIVAFAVRLAEHLVEKLRKVRATTFQGNSSL